MKAKTHYLALTEKGFASYCGIKLFGEKIKPVHGSFVNPLVVNCKACKKLVSKKAREDRAARV